MKSNLPSTRGTIVSAHGRHYSVRLADGSSILGYPRGKATKYACGDECFVNVKGSEGRIESIEERSSIFYRSDTYKQKLIAANVTMLIMVVATDLPTNYSLTTRCLVAAEEQGIKSKILVNKSDLASSEEKDHARDKISKIAPRPLPMIEISEGQVDPRVVLGLEAAAEDDLSSRPSHHDGAPDHDHADFESAVFSIDDLSSPEFLIDRVKRLADEEHILRVKGYAVVSGKPMRLLVQAVGGRVRTQYDRMWLPEEPKQGQLVVIAEHDHLNPSAIEKILAS